MEVNDAVLGAVFEYENQTALISGVAAETGNQVLECVPEWVQQYVTRKTDRKIEDRLGRQTWHGRGADVLNTRSAAAADDTTPPCLSSAPLRRS